MRKSYFPTVVAVFLVAVLNSPASFARCQDGDKAKLGEIGPDSRISLIGEIDLNGCEPMDSTVSSEVSVVFSKGKWNCTSHIGFGGFAAAVKMFARPSVEVFLWKQTDAMNGKVGFARGGSCPFRVARGTDHFLTDVTLDAGTCSISFGSFSRSFLGTLTFSLAENMTVGDLMDTLGPKFHIEVSCPPDPTTSINTEKPDMPSIPGPDDPRQPSRRRIGASEAS